MKRKKALFCAIILLLSYYWIGCKVYSLSGAHIAGKTVNLAPFQNRAGNVNPSLATTLENKIRSRILSQTGLMAVNDPGADYEMNAVITRYDVAISGAASNTTASQNRLTISIEVDFKNKLDDKASFKSSFSRFADFPANQQLQSVENSLVESIGNELADDIFNKAFVNW